MIGWEATISGLDRRQHGFRYKVWFLALGGAERAARRQLRELSTEPVVVRTIVSDEGRRG